MFSRSILAAAISLALMAHAHAAGTVTAEQIGNDNMTEITQQAVQHVSAATHQDGEDNRTYATQIGSNLTLTTSQSGVDNLLSVYQEGWDSQAQVNQTGESNHATVYQLPFDNAQLTANINQYGQGNQSYVSQRYANVTYAQTSQDGTDNFAQIEQTGQMSSISVSQFGGANSVTASQQGGVTLFFKMAPSTKWP